MAYLSLLDNRLNSGICRPSDSLQKVPRRCLLDLGNVRILMCRVRFMEVCEQGEQQYRFESVSFSVRPEDDLCTMKERGGSGSARLRHKEECKLTSTMAGNKSVRRK